MQQTFYVMWLMLADGLQNLVRHMLYEKPHGVMKKFLIDLSTSHREIDQIKKSMSVDVID